MMKSNTLLLCIGLLLFPVITNAQAIEIDQGNLIEQPACPPYSEDAHEQLKRFVANSLPHTANGVTVEAISPSEVAWVAQHSRCQGMNPNAESPTYVTFWRSNKYYFIVVRHKNPVRWIDENTLEMNLGTDSIDVLDLNLNLIRPFLF
ncbi:MAG: hypothetical protein LAT57_09285 [Balneolales bacterium]|nr:hypothetical protein [Balneolales bacterium]